MVFLRELKFIISLCIPPSPSLTLPPPSMFPIPVGKRALAVKSLSRKTPLLSQRPPLNPVLVQSPLYLPLQQLHSLLRRANLLLV